MTDGSKKKIIDIELKDNVAIGGFVFATGKFLVNDIYDYKNIKVSGKKHPITFPITPPTTPPTGPPTAIPIDDPIPAALFCFADPPSTLDTP